MSDISQLASRVGGKREWGTKLPTTLYYLAQEEGQGGGLLSIPLLPINLFVVSYDRYIAIPLRTF